jgi:hypothetical protein
MMILHPDYCQEPKRRKTETGVYGSQYNLLLGVSGAVLVTAAGTKSPRTWRVRGAASGVLRTRRRSRGRRRSGSVAVGRRV